MTHRKFHAEDPGLCNIANGFSSQNYGFQLENVVANELRRRGYNVHVGSLRGGEIDFVAQRFDRRIYIQVTGTMREESTRARELAPLQSLSDAFPKIVLTLDRFRLGTTSDGIEIRNIVDWLLG